MANEFKHKDPCTSLTQAEYISACGDGHIFACQATGDILYASSSTVLSKLAKGAANTVLSMGGSCIPAWTASPSVTDLTIGGGCITLSAATDIDLLDNNASALSFDASGKTGIIDIVTTNCSEGVTMSGTLGVTGVLTATGGLAGGAICIGSNTITTTGLISGGSLDIDNVLINGTTIGHTCDTDLMTVGNACLAIKGDVTVGVDDTGHDVKFFGAAAGAYMLYDQSEDQLEIRGASADATTSTGKLLLSTSLTNVNANDVIGSINFQAPAEAGGTDAVAIAAGIRAVAQATFTCAVNATDLIFYTGHSEAATEKFRFTSQGEIGIGGTNYGNCGQFLKSQGAGSAAVWACASGGGTTINNATADELVTIGSTTTELCAEATLTFPFNASSSGGTNDLGNFTVTGAATFQTGNDWKTGQNPPFYFVNLDANGGDRSHVVRIKGGANASNSNVLEIQDYSGNTDFKVTGSGQTLHADGAVCAPSISFASDTDNGFWMPGANNFRAVTNGIDMFNVHEANGGWNIEFGDTSCGNGDRSMSLNQGCKDNVILSLKSSDVGHAMTGQTEADTYGLLKKFQATGGGMLIDGYKDADCSNWGALWIRGNLGEAAATAKNCSGYAIIQLDARITDGSTGVTSPGSDANLVSISSNTDTVFIFDEEGTAHADVGTATFDDYCDVELLRGFLATTCDQYKQNYVDKFGEHLMYNQQWYEDNKLIGKCSIHWKERECGRMQQRAMVNMTGLTMLHHSTIIQLADQMNARLDGIETQLKALQGGCP
jgi:hypothetical protein